MNLTISTSILLFLVHLTTFSQSRVILINGEVKTGTVLKLRPGLLQVVGSQEWEIPSAFISRIESDTGVLIMHPRSHHLAQDSGAFDFDDNVAVTRKSLDRSREIKALFPLATKRTFTSDLYRLNRAYPDDFFLKQYEDNLNFSYLRFLARACNAFLIEFEQSQDLKTMTYTLYSNPLPTQQIRTLLKGRKFRMVTSDSHPYALAEKSFILNFKTDSRCDFAQGKKMQELIYSVEKNQIIFVDPNKSDSTSYDVVAMSGTYLRYTRFTPQKITTKQVKVVPLQQGSLH